MRKITNHGEKGNMYRGSSLIIDDDRASIETLEGEFYPK